MFCSVRSIYSSEWLSDKNAQFNIHMWNLLIDRNRCWILQNVLNKAKAKKYATGKRIVSKVDKNPIDHYLVIAGPHEIRHSNFANELIRLFRPKIALFFKYCLVHFGNFRRNWLHLEWNRVLCASHKFEADAATVFPVSKRNLPASTSMPYVTKGAPHWKSH